MIYWPSPVQILRQYPSPFQIEIIVFFTIKNRFGKTIVSNQSNQYLNSYAIGDIHKPRGQNFGYFWPPSLLRGHFY